MKFPKFAELNLLEDAVLDEKLTEAYQTLQQARLQASVRQLENTAQLGKLKHLIAQIKTIQTKRKTASQQPQEKNSHAA
jgi:ribosomal protein L29